MTFCFYAAVPAVVEMADELLAEDGCRTSLPGRRIKTSKCRLISTTSITTARTSSVHRGSTDDMKEAIALSATGQLQPSFMVGPDIGGLDAVPETVLNLPDIPGGKKLIYNGVTMPLTAIADFAESGN